MPAKTLAKPKPSTLTRAQAREVQALAWPDRWAENLRLEVDAHPFNLRGREYQRQVLRDEAESIVNPKGAQLGWTTCFIIKACHAAVTRRRHILYLLPLKAGSIQFVQGRIDPIIDSNAKLKDEFSRTDNRSQKQTKGGVNWYIRGTNIHTELREVPADVLILDERDKANEENLADAYERIGGSDWQRVYELSTPTIDGHGVYGEDGWPASDQHRWWVPCPHCATKQVLTWDENVLPWLGETKWETECHCSHCKLRITDNDRAAMNEFGTWVPEAPGASKRGYHLSQLNSPTKRLAGDKSIVENYFAGQLDVAKLKAFYNLGLGLPYAAPGDKFSVELMDKARKPYTMGGNPGGAVFIGVDVGHNVLYVTMWVIRNRRRCLWQAKMILPEVGLTKWQVFERDVLQAVHTWVAVVDAHPDKEQVEALSKKYSGRLFMGFEKDRPDQPDTASFLPHKHGEPAKVNIDRTMAFDSLIKEYIDGNTELPMDARDLGEHMPKKGYNAFYHQHLQMVRVEQPDAQGRMIARWLNTAHAFSTDKKKTEKQGNRPDHWHHSDMFAKVATFKEAPLQVSAEVGNLFAAAGGIIAA